MIEFLEVSLASYFYFCPFTPGAFSMPRGRKEVSFFSLCFTNFVWRKAEEKFTKNKEGVRERGLGCEKSLQRLR